uniref:Uncharacterized protein n=1 Tax=Caenorhabditis japonica TaxID=281687 RepID=A0A8R1EKE5_CAEJA
MSDQRSVTIPTPHFSTYATVIDPPRQVTATHPEEITPTPPSSVPQEPSIPVSATPVRVPYPSAAPPIPPPVAPPSVPKKMAFAPSCTKNYKTKRTFKVIIVGNAAVGKTCLSFRFCCCRFPEHTEATIGVDFRERSCAIENELLRVQLWDTAGQERYRQSIVAHYYRNVNAVVFVYDVTC